MDYRIDPTRATAPSRQLVEAVLDEMAGGRLRPGDRLPSVRAMAAQALVNPNTVGKAYRELEAMGAVEGVNGSGVFVTPAGPEHARAERQAAALSRLETAMERALAAGLDRERLETVIDAWLAKESKRANAQRGARAPVGG